MMTSPKPPFAPLEEQSALPLYRQLYDRVLAAVAAGTLSPGDRLPSARAMAKELGVARGTVELAYSLLASEGYLLALGQKGTVINPELQKPVSEATALPVSSQVIEDAPDSLWRPPQLLPFQMGVPALDAFPRKIWARLGARYLRGMRLGDLDYPAPHGLAALRSAIASYLQVSRGIDCGAHQVFITSGWRNSLSLVAHTLLQPGECAWVEDPGYPTTRQVLRQFGLDLEAVPVDAEGMNVEHAIAGSRTAQVVMVTPGHQSPLSMALSLPRRQLLLDWAARTGGWIVEDDYDGEYRYVSRPLPALASLDRHGRVLYAGTFSKVLFPGIRLAYLVVPQAQVAAFERVGRALFAAGSPSITQALVAEFVAEGHFARHIQRMRRLYNERRALTIEALDRSLPKGLQVERSPGGMHLVLRLPEDVSDTALAEQVLARGMSVQALSRWAASSQRQSGLLLSFTNCATTAPGEQLGALISKLLS
ncbi:PLP-dependent aminotransferase family protein [Pseudomonas alloputida]|jgi:GntR family transcriptional regulator/MocR family aminotransferase|uniref:PLP-dependent aminotransferase family protein n=2 Tax=Pseudomonas TaxID=286 RepID=A0ABY3D0H4_9PSED|nr:MULTISPECIES: PLP-dependent aminotransferase family protein [Pseudomonas]AVF57478.1 PLP-dependent aminotransferase family protein [Pseudomonas fulva]MBH3362349.1 PLP-dependent aminotransferase family protein [Pseudomonas sp. URMO17WK12:I11]MBT9238664.1 PLP-dependent aminotransferase family protein [Pseudomonas sp. MG-2]MCM8914914.1 PLP-dependent aminotransferase family protein [Pseudomonas inefficax]MCV9918716.1 PLP-dependent aminotransferase family protein [Pseudomonas sp. BT-42-2]